MSLIKKLPSVFDTKAQRKFFDSTFDQVFSKKDSDLLKGFLGRRNPGEYDPINDFYIPEPDKNRTWWQLEPTVFAKNKDTTKSNIFFYEDLLNHLKFYGADISNQNRLFESEYYSWAPPIDFDMFVNYQNYYWIEQRLSAISISGVTVNDILTSTDYPYTTPSTAVPANLTLSTGMRVLLIDDTTSDIYGNPYATSPHTIENVGITANVAGLNNTSTFPLIRLVPDFPDFTSGTSFEFLPWDTSTNLPTGYIIQNGFWDQTSWEIQPQATSGDYITIQRGSKDQNAWSRTNKWYHIDVINKTNSINGSAFPTNATRGLRPIIQFNADLELYNSGSHFNNDINYGFANDETNSPLRMESLQNLSLTAINTRFSIDMNVNDLVVFFNDDTPIGSFDDSTWDMTAWDTSIAPGKKVNDYIWKVTLINNKVLFVPYHSFADFVNNGDIVFALFSAPYGGAARGDTWYFSSGAWIKAANDKVSVNQPPLFQLYDHDNVSLNDVSTYPDSIFSGSKIFSYKTNNVPGARIDPVLGFPIVYTSLGQATDIVFENNLITDRYTYSTNLLSINGYYYYKTVLSNILYNGWNLYSPDINTVQPISRQHVIDKFVVGFDTNYQFKLSVKPYRFDNNDSQIIVSVNGKEVKSSSHQSDGYTLITINNDIYVDLSLYLSSIIPIATVAPVVEISTFTLESLNDDATGYFEIPQQLEANPSHQEISTISASDLSQHFASIINAQTGFTGVAFGGNNNYRDTLKNNTLGTFILQNKCPLLKTMLVSSSDDLDLISSIRFSGDEYTKFKNKYIKTSLQMINQGFNPVQYHNNTIVLSQWVDQILSTINISKEFSDSFAYSYMIASGGTVANETHVVPSSGTVLLNYYLDLNDLKNALYLYDKTGQERLLIIGQDYEIISTNLSIEVQFIPNNSQGSNIQVGDSIYFAFYKNPAPAYIPSTPSKLGMWNVYIPHIILDNSFTIPTNVIVGHDGSRTVAYGDYRDQLLLELEKRIYNLIQVKFRNEYNIPLRLESAKPGYFRKTRYQRHEYLEITESYINKWSAKNKTNYRTNEFSKFVSILPSNSPEIWKLYNYSDAVNSSLVHLNLPGNWKGIFDYYYDTHTPNTTPWKMLGFSQQPNWWVSQYGTNWSSTNTALWNDLENGIIRQGPCAVYDPITLLPVPNPLWARPGLSSLIPVDSTGNIVPVPVLFNIPIASITDPFDGFDKDWVYGDGSPVEQVWYSSSVYTFNAQEFMYLMRPNVFGELFFDTLGTENSPSIFNISGIGDVQSNTNWQYVQNSNTDNINDDPLYYWMRPKNKDQYVHAENINNQIQIKFGYQRWISDAILFKGLNVGDVFGQKIRTLDVNLANQFAGFTNKDTVTTYIQSISPTASSTTLSIPSNNFDVLLHTSQPDTLYNYSGVIITALGNGKFAVYGYDLLKSEFTILNRSLSTLIDVTVGGIPAEFRYFTSGDTYAAGEIVRYNGVYYQSAATQTVVTFSVGAWIKLSSLPTVGGISVDYKPESLTSTTKIPYGSILNTAQDVFDLLIGWGAYLEQQGWQFDNVNSDTNQISDWLYSAKQFLFWLNTSWAPNASIQLSPLANSATVIVKDGYPANVETISNGVYSILDKYGISIPSTNTQIDRDGKSITVSPSDLSSGGIYFLSVHALETEHIIIFDNTTSFNDIIYNPLLRIRQERILFNGFRSNGWYGKMEAPGYLIVDNQLIPNYDTIVDSMRFFYDPDVLLDNPSLDALGRHLIGYENKSYLDNLQISDDSQYLFYQGFIREKGTEKSFDKLFRTKQVQSNEVIEVFEEWALKKNDFGNTVEQVTTEFILKPEINSGEVIVARLNFQPSTIGSVKEINILNATDVYKNVPKIIISVPDANSADPALMHPLRQAKAFAVLDANNKISRIDLIDSGYGYLSAPVVSIDTNGELLSSDRLYSVWQGELITDTTLNNVIDIGIYDTDTWTLRPQDPAYTLQFPKTSMIEYTMPNAGYVHANDVDWKSFNVDQTISNWGSVNLNPIKNDKIWVAKNFVQDWNIYNLTQFEDYFSIIVDDANNLILQTLASKLLTVEGSVSGVVNDFGNLIALQVLEPGIKNVNGLNNHCVGFNFIGLDSTNTYNQYNLVFNDGSFITANDLADYNEITNVFLFKSMRFFHVPVGINILPTYVGINDHIWVDDNNGKWTVFTVTPLPDNFDVKSWDIPPTSVWGPYYGWDTNGPFEFVPFRMQEDLIKTTKFNSAQIYDSSTQSELVLLPVFDPFKDILPALVKQNITYFTEHDPARYNVTGNTRLFDQDIIFGAEQVGKLWLDLSNFRYMYYEQPIALDNSESASDNLEYRRNNWGQLFPGSSIDVYEWTQSSVPPANYTGSGIPRDVTTYVQNTKVNKFTNVIETTYYFWVKNSTTQPNILNRTLTSVDVASLLLNPKAQNFSFFAPIQQTSTNNSYMFYNVQELLIYKGNNIQIKYKVSDRDDQPHTQWSLFREGDDTSLINDQYWNKFVDSICGYTDILPINNNYGNKIFVAKDLPFDMFPYDIEAWDTATSSTTPVYGEILPVPDPSLSVRESFGITYRPRQGMFVNITNARNVFVQAANALLQYIPIKDVNSSWNNSVLTDNYWEYITWYAKGYENAIPTHQFETLPSADIALSQGELKLNDIIEVSNGTADGRFVIYVVTQVNASSQLSLTQIGIESSAIKLLDTIYTDINSYNLTVELRQLLTAFRKFVFVDQYIVDQNNLFFSMLNYVLSEQKNPNWLFKTSYIFIKEHNIPLTQSNLFVSDQINNIIDYINDAKPYHVQIRDYSTAYVSNDNAIGTAIDGVKDTNGNSDGSFVKKRVSVSFGPDENSQSGWDINLWDSQGWEDYPNFVMADNALDAKQFVDTVNQIISGTATNTDDTVIPVNTIPLTNFDPSKTGYSSLYPYTFNINSINLNNPQTIITPENIVGVLINNHPLYYGQDYFVINNNDNTYTVYFFNPIPTGVTPQAIVWFFGGNLANVNFDSYRNEVAFGFSYDNIVFNVDTKLPIISNNDNSITAPINQMWDFNDGIITTLTTNDGWDAGAPATITSFESMWDSMSFDPVIVSPGPEDGWDAQVPADNSGGIMPWDQTTTDNIILLNNRISFKEDCNTDEASSTLYRNANTFSAQLTSALFATTETTENIEVIFVMSTNDSLPNPTHDMPGIIWINGERIEYKLKSIISPNNWELKYVTRGTHGTASTYHPNGSKIFVENGQEIFNANGHAWNTVLPGTNVVPTGGLWYANTSEANFLKDEQGNALS